MTPPDNEVQLPIAKLRHDLEQVTALQDLPAAIVNLPFQNYPVEMALLFLGFICFYVIDDTGQAIKLAAASDTEHYRMSIAGYDFDPDTFRIELDNPSNSIAKAFRESKPVATEDWATLQRPEASDETTRLNQASSGIAYSRIYPLSGPVRGALMFNYFQYQDNIGPQQIEFMENYTALISSLVNKKPVPAQ